MRTLFLTFFYSGKSPWAPGTVGTFAGVPFALLILAYMPPSTLFLSALFLAVFSVKHIDAYESQSGIHDDKSIVIDEVAGVWLALSIAPAISIPWSSYTVLQPDIWAQVVLSIGFFRLYDIWKPSLIGRIDREVQGGWGVMGDDIAAGFVAGVSSALTWQLIYILKELA